MNFVCGLPVFATSSPLTWYGLSRLIRSSHLADSSPIETHTSVYRKSAPLTPSVGSSVSVIRAPVCSARSATRLDQLLVRPQALRRGEAHVHAELGRADHE